MKLDCLAQTGGGSHSSVDSSAPTILRSRVRNPSTPSTLLYGQILYYSTKFDKNFRCTEKRTKIYKYSYRM